MKPCFQVASARMCLTRSWRPIIAQLKEQVEAQAAEDREAKDQALQLLRQIIQQLKEALRLERIRKYGKQSEKLSDLQLEFSIASPVYPVTRSRPRSAAARCRRLSKTQADNTPAQSRERKPHPGRNELSRASGADRRDHRLRARAVQVRQVRRRDQGHRLRRDRGAWHEARRVLRDACSSARSAPCTSCAERGVTAPRACAHRAEIDLRRRNHHRIHHSQICRQLAACIVSARCCMRDLGIDVALTTINDAVLRVGELLIPVVDGMKRDLLTGGYIQADETHVDVQTPEKKGQNHRAFFWQYSAPGKGVIFDFEMTRGKQVPKSSSRTMAAYSTPMDMPRTKKTSAPKI